MRFDPHPGAFSRSMAETSSPRLHQVPSADLKLIKNASMQNPRNGLIVGSDSIAAHLPWDENTYREVISSHTTDPSRR